MSGELTHAGLQELLGAYALDAVDGDEREAVERHLPACPRCRAEVAEHREVAAYLAHTGLRAPDHLWDRIAEALEETPPALDLATVLPLAPTRRRLRRAGVALGAAAAAVAVASVAIIGVQLADVLDRVDRTEAAMVQGDVLQAALVAETLPEARTVRLRSDDGAQSARAVVLPDGRGYLIPGRMATLPEGRTYQLWAIVGRTPISAGVLGGTPRVAPFQLGSARGATLALTIERVPGAVSPTSDPALAGVLA